MDVTRYRTFVADPPWRYQNTSSRGAAENHYDTMSIDDIRALTVVADSAADDAHLYLWSTSPHLPEAFSVMEAWGFEYRTQLMWMKPQMGMGNYFRVGTEIVLFGTRGDAEVPVELGDEQEGAGFISPRRKHSQKPSEFPEMVMDLSPGPYMELFSRCNRTRDIDAECGCTKCRFGWAVWGNQS
ncbi:hypothetical protein AOT83_19110 [Mycobacteroides sp. H001]|nr:hypothetical protein AOT86_11340 [Mycobacteroides sp. H072]KRQ32608.1 hypothetical protein AOT84_20610 [Mycobacteroides sp. H002]KRQ54034.1 hypothetical protein AOT85_05110 [Mycobacteroides sp. H054]KRQ68026.1 hypothetical protein AOT83_19110 [Mycobacteroides sp. H001]